jgi:hypothetical protein
VIPAYLSTRQITNVISVVCDAVHRLVVEDDAAGAIRRLEEAAAGLHAELSERDAEGDGLTHALRAVKTLAHVMEHLADENIDLAEVQIRAAVDAISAAVHRIRSAYGDERSPGGKSASVQMSVNEASRVPNAEAISDALENLMSRTEPDAFVIFVNADTGHFVQFIGSRGRALVLEMPISSLGEDLIARAEEFFRRRGAAGARGEESFSVALGEDVRIGTSFALGILEQVYRSGPNFPLKIEEN